VHGSPPRPSGAFVSRSTTSVQIGTASLPSGTGKSAAAARSKWLKKKSGTPLCRPARLVTDESPDPPHVFGPAG
jgi:hypothetical protein